MIWGCFGNFVSFVIQSERIAGVGDVSMESANKG